MRSRPSFPVATKNSILMKIEGRHRDNRCHDYVHVTETKTKGQQGNKEVATRKAVIREIT